MTAVLGSATAQGAVRPINRPFPCIANVALFNALSPANYKLFAYNVFSYLASSDVLGTNGLLTEPVGE